MSKLGKGWKKIFKSILNSDKRNKAVLYNHLYEIKNDALGDICPSNADIFNCFRDVAYNDVLCALIGNDPYPYTGFANGYSFCIMDDAQNSSGHGKAVKTILGERKRDEYVCTGKEITMPKSRNIQEWGKHGVILLNRVLTIKQATTIDLKENPFSEIWEGFIQEVLNRIAEREKKCVFIFFGDTWNKFVKEIKDEWEEDGQNLVLQYPHPSSTKFSTTGHGFFSKTIDHLHDWELEDRELNFNEYFPMPSD